MVTLKRAYAVAGLGPALQEQLAAGLLREKRFLWLNSMTILILLKKSLRIFNFKTFKLNSNLN